MKKLVVLAFALVLTSCNQTNIAYIDVEDLMKNYDATKVLEETLKAKQETMAKELDSLGKPFQLKVQEYYKKAQRMSQAQRVQTEQALQEENKMLQAKQQEAAQVLQKENQKRSEEITKRVDSFVTDYAKLKGLHLVLGTSGHGTVMYGDDKLNITDKIVELLNNNFTKK